MIFGGSGGLKAMIINKTVLQKKYLKIFLTAQHTQKI
jgi:hypothetical protein